MKESYAYFSLIWRPFTFDWAPSYFHSSCLHEYLLAARSQADQQMAYSSACASFSLFFIDAPSSTDFLAAKRVLDKGLKLERVAAHCFVPQASNLLVALKVLVPHQNQRWYLLSTCQLLFTLRVNLEHNSWNGHRLHHLMTSRYRWSWPFHLIHCHLQDFSISRDWYQFSSFSLVTRAVCAAESYWLTLSSSMVADFHV